MDRYTRLRIQNLSYILALVCSVAYYLSYTSALNIANQSNIYSALVVVVIAIAFTPTKEILTLILGKAMGISPSYFLKCYQTDHPIEKSIHRLTKEYIPHLHCLYDIIIEGPLTEEHSAHLLTIIEEAIKNTAMYSAAAVRADINLFVNHQKIKLFLQDDGQGFSVFSLTPKQQGLAKIKRLVQRMGGSHKLETDQSGTAHWIEIPLKIL